MHTQTHTHSSSTASLICDAGASEAIGPFINDRLIDWAHWSQSLETLPQPPGHKLNELSTSRKCLLLQDVFLLAPVPSSACCHRPTALNCTPSPYPPSSLVFFWVCVCVYECLLFLYCSSVYGSGQMLVGSPDPNHHVSLHVVIPPVWHWNHFFFFNGFSPLFFVSCISSSLWWFPQVFCLNLHSMWLCGVMQFSAWGVA